MCIEVGVKHKNGSVARCDTVKALAGALGMEPAELSDGPDSACLCKVDLGTLHARRATTHEGYPSPTYIIDRHARAH